MKRLIGSLIVAGFLVGNCMAADEPTPIIKGTEIHKGVGYLSVLTPPAPNQEKKKDVFQTYDFTVSRFTDSPNHVIVSYVIGIEDDTTSKMSTYPVFSFEGWYDDKNKNHIKINKYYFNIPFGKTYVTETSSNSECRLKSSGPSQYYNCDVTSKEFENSETIIHATLEKTDISF